MVLPNNHFFTAVAYFDLEEKAYHKSEFLSGQIYAMACGSPLHSLVAGNTFTALSQALAHKPCLVFNSDLKISDNLPKVSNYTFLSCVVILH